MDDKCSICGDYAWKSVLSGKPHKCLPAWWCWISDPDYDMMERDDGETIHALHADDAAIKYMADYDVHGDYICIGGDEIQVSVAPTLNPDSVQIFRVRGEMVPEYWAEQDT